MTKMQRPKVLELDPDIGAMLHELRNQETEQKLGGDVSLRDRWLNAFFQGATAGLMLLDRDFRYIKVNETLAEMHGIPVSDHIGRKVREVIPALAPAIEPTIQKVLSTGKPALDIEIEGETHKHPRVQRYWLSSYFPIIGADSRPEIVGAIIVEITNQKRAEETAHQYAKEVEETRSALKVLIKQRENDRRELEEMVLANVKQLVMPYIEMMKIRRRDSPEDTECLNIVKTNLNEIISPFVSQLSHKLTSLTPREVLLSDLVKAGKSDKDIAEVLHLSVDTVKSHRRHIRKKLGLTGKRANLRTFLSNIDNKYDS